MFIWQLPQSPKFYSVLLYGHTFSSYRPFRDKWNQITTKKPEQYKVQCTLYTHSCHSRLPNSFPVALQLAAFELQAILVQVHRKTPKWPWTLKVLIWNFKIPASNFCEDRHREHSEKFGPKRIKTVRRVAFWNFPPIGSHFSGNFIFF